MVKPTNTSAITKATNRPWDDWVAALDAAGAREMNHGDIAKQALKLMPEPVEQKGWWAQGVAIAYEQHWPAYSGSVQHLQFPNLDLQDYPR